MNKFDQETTHLKQENLYDNYVAYVENFFGIDSNNKAYQEARFQTQLSLDFASCFGGLGLAKAPVKGVSLYNRAINAVKKATPVQRTITSVAQSSLPGLGEITKTCNMSLKNKKTNLNKLHLLEKDLSEWLGSNSKMFKNKYGDHIFLSQDGKRRLRFDFNHTMPHENPHAHLEECRNIRWNKDFRKNII